MQCYQFVESTDMSSESYAYGEDEIMNPRRSRKPVSRNSGSKTGRGIGNDAAHLSNENRVEYHRKERIDVRGHKTDATRAP